MDEEDEQTLSLVLFSGTDDKLNAAAILATGAAAMGRKVDIFLQYWGLKAFRRDHTRQDHGAAPEAGTWAHLVPRHDGQHWSELLAQAREIGEVRIHACAQSMELFGITSEDLDPLVDDVEGVAAFVAEATGQMVFI